MKILVIAAALIAFTFQTTRSVRDGVYTEDQRKRGAELVTERCVKCHGGDLNGGEEAPGLFGANFLSSWNGLTVGDLSERIRTSMPPIDPGMNSAQQRADIISMILSVNGYPAGQKELETRTEVLRQIKIEPTK